MKKLSICLFSLALSFHGKAQVRIGVTGGYHHNFSSPAFYKPENIISAEKTSLRSGHFGVIADIPISSKNWHFQTGVSYFKRGQNQFITLDTNQRNQHFVDARQEQNYIDLPFSIVYKQPLTKNLRLIAGGGLQVSLFASGLEVVTNTNRIIGRDLNLEDSSYVVIREEKQENLLVGKEFNRYKLTFFSANGFAGFEFKNIYLTANYSKGLTSYYERENEKFKHDSWSGTLGIYLFRSKPESEQNKVIDTDKDGIEDELDECSTLAGPAITKGCPDKDADGIADAKDNCPELVGIQKYNGCPIPDSDNDGTNDEEDKCPKEAGPKSNNGCPVKEIAPKPEEKTPETKVEVIDQKVVEQVNLSAKQIAFKFGRASLTNDSYTVLDEIVNLLKDADVKIRVEGHSSLEGNAKSNLKLSQDRADNVKAYLVSKGISANRITAMGYGSTRPLVKGASEKANMQNRRVEINIDK
jgi:outer membrane protein OmpA-like peptidoglycan-associated protein